MAKNINTRIILKHDTEANWNKAINFIPNKGEVIIYDIDENFNYERVKIGDGVNNAIQLPFVNDNYLAKDNAIEYTPADDYNPATKKYVDDATTTATTGVVKYSETQELTDEEKTQARNNIGADGYNWHLIYESDYTKIYFANNSETKYNIENWEAGLKIISPTDDSTNALYKTLVKAHTLTSNYIGNFILSKAISEFVENANALLDAGIIKDDFYCIKYKQSDSDMFTMTIKYNKKTDRWMIYDGSPLNGNISINCIIFYSDGTILYNSIPFTDKTLSLENKPADSKTVGDRFTEVESSITTLENEKTDILDTAYLNSKLKGVYSSTNEIVSNVILNDYLVGVYEYVNEQYPQLNHSYLVCEFPQINTLDVYNVFVFQIKGYYNNEVYTVSWISRPRQSSTLDLMVAGKYICTARGKINPLEKWDPENEEWIDSEDTFTFDISVYNNSLVEGVVMEDLMESLKNAEFSFYAMNQNFLPLNNTIEFTPDRDYEPATKKYVDDSVTAIDIQADWSVSDETDKAYIQNRTHYEEEEITYETILEEYVEVIHNLPESAPEYKTWFSTTLSLINGDNYIITFDGITKTVKCENNKLEFTLKESDNWNYTYVIDTNTIRGIDFDTSDYAGDLKIEHEIKSTQVKTLDEKYIPDTILRVADQTQSDWNVNDPTDKAYIQNRTHYEATTTTLENILTEEVAMESTPSHEFPDIIDIIDGETYTVTFNGVSQEIVCELGTLPFEYNGYIYEITFSFIEDPEGTAELLNGTLTIDHHVVGTEVKTLDEKYIPDSIARADDIIQSDWN